MTGEKRRTEIVRELTNASAPLSGTYLAGRFSVSRQVIVQDIALLRADNKEVLSTNKGYYLHRGKSEGGERFRRVFYVNHSTEDTLTEFCAIVDFGGRVLDISIDHDLYGQIQADLLINNRLDAKEFVAQMAESRHLPLKALTDGGHYHTVEAETERQLDFIEMELERLGYLCKI